MYNDYVYCYDVHIIYVAKWIGTTADNWCLLAHLI